MILGFIIFAIGFLFVRLITHTGIPNKCYSNVTSILLKCLVYQSMNQWDTKDVNAFLDVKEPDLTLRCINWCVDLYIFTDQPEKALLAKWSRANYLLGVD